MNSLAFWNEVGTSKVSNSGAREYQDAVVGHREKSPAVPQPGIVAAYCSLAKPRITLFLLFVTACGFWLGHSGRLRGSALVPMLFATALLSAGIFALNQYLERETDRLMQRTADRALPSGRLRPGAALLFSLVCLVVAEVCFFLFVSALAAILALIVAFSYDFLYTPLKQRSWWSVVMGAVPGALPPVIGWVSAGRPLDLAAGLLFTICFLWQFPHFHAIAWLCREDYARAGICMLPVIEGNGRSTARQIVLTASALVPVSLLPVWWNIAGPRYGVTALLLGLSYVAFGLVFRRARTSANARLLLWVSLLYLPLLLGVMALDRNHQPTF